ncbi:MAG: hypothetical protein WKG01_22125 [Kofleriaceae bacterium]
MTATPTGPMPRDERAYVIAMCAIIGGAFAYAACEWGQWPRLFYFPLAESFAMGPRNLVSIGFLGIVAWGIGGMICGALVGAVLCRVVPRRWTDRVYHLFGAWALTAVMLAGLYYTWGLWPW